MLKQNLVNVLKLWKFHKSDVERIGCIKYYDYERGDPHLNRWVSCFIILKCSINKRFQELTKKMKLIKIFLPERKLPSITVILLYMLKV